MTINTNDANCNRRREEIIRMIMITHDSNIHNDNYDSIKITTNKNDGE